VRKEKPPWPGYLWGTPSIIEEERLYVRIGEIYRYARPYKEEPDKIGDYPNYFALVFVANQRLPLLDRGISPIQEIKATDGKRRPAILISSSPHKIGSRETPWQDFFDSDNGHIRYYGDNKDPSRSPEKTPGNRVLLEAYRIQTDSDYHLRCHSTPLIFFERVSKDGKQKGFVKFQGFGIIERVELVTQYDRRNGWTFTNYVFDFAVLSLKEDKEVFNWDWINNRRDPSLDLENTLVGAPYSWKQWLKAGPTSLDRYRRRVSKLMTFTADEQRGPTADPATREAQVLQQIYEYYAKQKRCFEALAGVVTEQILTSSGGKYRFGWITRPPDGGTDFIGRLDIGSGFGATKLIVLGQAKCENPLVPTGGNHIARTVARLKRGWIGVYVTTSYFSEAVQREVIEDEYPIVLINGLRVTQEVISLAHGKGCSVQSLLEEVEKDFNTRIQVRRPEEILRD